MIISDVDKSLELRHEADIAPDALSRTEEEQHTRRNVPDSVAAVITKLELKGIKVTLSQDEKEEGNYFRAVSVSCKSWMCSCCRLSKGLNLRETLLSKVGLFKVPRLYTVTVNRNNFLSPQKAYEYVMHGKFLARLLTKEMGVIRWFWVLEAQEESGEGWPHWHILIDVGDLPGMWYHKESQTAQAYKPDVSSGWCYVPHFFDLNRVHYLLKKWNIGDQCKLSIRRDEFQNPEHAIRYITKYLIKPPKRDFPPWMYNYKGLRFYQPSKAIGSMSAVKLKARSKDSETDCKQRESRLPVDRIAECCKSILFISYNHRQDKFIKTKPIKAIKESVAVAPGAISVQDFDFKTLRPFTVWGFNNIEYMQNFEKMWSDLRLQTVLNNQIKTKRLELLQRWTAYDAGCA